MSEAKITKKDWVEEYAHRIFAVWQKWKGPLGISKEYMSHLKEELEKKFDDPLKRTLVEMNHPVDTAGKTSSSQKYGSDSLRPYGA